MTLLSDIEKIATTTGLGDVVVEGLAHDEHARYQFYLHALSVAPVASERELIATILRDPDRIMAEAAVVGHIDRRASVLHSAKSFAEWGAQIRDLVDPGGFIARRLNEWELFKRVMAGETDSVDSLTDASDWLQRKVSEEAVTPEVLAKLAEYGRTKRVRNIAKSRSRALRR